MSVYVFDKLKWMSFRRIFFIIVKFIFDLWSLFFTYIYLSCSYFYFKFIVWSLYGMYFCCLWCMSGPQEVQIQLIGIQIKDIRKDCVNRFLVTWMSFFSEIIGYWIYCFFATVFTGIIYFYIINFVFKPCWLKCIATVGQNWEYSW